MTRESFESSIRRAVQAERAAQTIEMIVPTLALVAALMAVAFAFVPGGRRSAVFVGSFAAIAVLSYLLNRRGHNRLAAGLLITVLVLAPVLEPLTTGDPSTNIAFTGVTAVLALMLTEWRYRWWVLGAVIAVTVLTIIRTDPALTAPVTRMGAAVSGTALLVLSLVTGLWLLQSYRVMIERAAAAQRTAEARARELAEVNDGLAAAVAAREVELADAIESQRHLAEQLAESALRDPLTGLWNRRYLDQLPLGPDGPAAVALLDVDHFKRFNDTYSYEVGDEVLRRIANTLQANVTAPAALTRYGGEEFAVLIPADDDRDAVAFAEQLRLAVAAMSWDQLPEGLDVTISIGVCVGPCHVSDGQGSPVRVMLRCADRALTLAKTEGRNRTSVSACRHT